MNQEIYEALKRLIYQLHKTPVKGINGNDFVAVRDWIDEVEKDHKPFKGGRYRIGEGK